jgi:hypothetical protein
MTTSYQPLVSKAAIAYSLSIGSGRARESCERLFCSLTLREIGVLRRNKELVEEVQDIAKMTTAELIIELANNYDLEIERLVPGQVIGESYWIGIEQLEDAIPEWFSTTHDGWHKFDKDEDFSNWAKDFLLQEVRINMWIRLLEQRKKIAEQT